MAGYLIGEEGPLSGSIIRFEEKEQWVLGRDPDEADIVLEDPMVSRRHVICSFTPEGYLLENLSAVNPATQNGKVIAEAVLLREGDIIQIGNTFFRFTEQEPSLETEGHPHEMSSPFEEDLSEIHLDLSTSSRWLIKVIAGPNSGAEFGMNKGAEYILGKDPNLCDITFQDLSVSRQHARLFIDEEQHVFIEDLGSRNGTLVNGELISEKKELSSQDVLALGTTTLLIIDREKASETIVATPPLPPPRVEAVPAEEETAAEMISEKKPRDWREMIISKKHLSLATLALILLLIISAALFSLFQTETVPIVEKNEPQQIKNLLVKYPDIQFSYSEASGKLLLLGHVLTAVDKHELLYQLKTQPFIRSIDDNIVVDEYVWQNSNALLSVNPDWVGVSIYAPSPGHFVIRGYVRSLDQLESLTDYINRNFPYLDRLESQVVVENNLVTQIQSMLIEKGFSGVVFELSNGELVLSGRVDSKTSDHFQYLIDEVKKLQGIRLVKNFVIYTSADTSRIDLSDKFRVTGYSTKDEEPYFVVINGKILSPGDTLEGMVITSVLPNMVLLEKDGLKFKINYNLQ